MNDAPAPMPLRDIEAEQAILGAMLIGIEPEIMVRVREMVPSPRSFSRLEHGHIYAAMCALVDRGTSLDIITVRDQLEVTKLLSVVGGIEAVATLVDSVPTAANVLFHADIVRDLFLRRELARLGREAGVRAEVRDATVESVYAETVQAIVAAAAPAMAKGAELIGSHLGGVLEDLTERGTSLLDRGAVSTGLDDVDEYLGGFAPGRLVIFAARPKMGKTDLALHCARQAAEYGPVYFVSREMGKDELVERLLCSEAGVHRKRRGHPYSDKDVQLLLRATKTLNDLPLWIDTETKTPGMLRLKLAAEIAHGRKPALVVVDYLQLLRWPAKTENRNIEVGKISGALKTDIAKDLDVPVLALSQLNRGSVEHGKPRPPVLTDLRDSGSLEQDADQILMLHYAGAKNGRDSMPDWPDASKTELYIEGNRHGPGGKIDVYYHRPTGVWRQWSRFDRQEEAA